MIGGHLDTSLQIQRILPFEIDIQPCWRRRQFASHASSGTGCCVRRLLPDRLGPAEVTLSDTLSLGMIVAST